ncbi:ABC-type cobalt transport system substrate-binding protein [Litorivivens lipolytica]|uniref:ABC-type cobalt transport system substrate-binding protein n=1 Tax=Litorivivens lipolytica TaxID=1524264 RepID=A0A7W4W679_9GAMM|nr:hypothetical protein [Litorivivens lipolytica]MBB3048189.1 ABC-type cobalt transport system substrate-binding protein [Litorivivens lipolytica]
MGEPLSRWVNHGARKAPVLTSVVWRQDLVNASRISRSSTISSEIFGGADDDANRHIDHIAFHQEFLNSSNMG